MHLFTSRLWLFRIIDALCKCSHGRVVLPQLVVYEILSFIGTWPPPRKTYLQHSRTTTAWISGTLTMCVLVTSSAQTNAWHDTMQINKGVYLHRFVWYFFIFASHRLFANTPAHIMGRTHMIQIYANIETLIYLKLNEKKHHLYCILCIYLHRIACICVVSGVGVRGGLSAHHTSSCHTQSHGRTPKSATTVKTQHRTCAHANVPPKQYSVDRFERSKRCSIEHCQIDLIARGVGGEKFANCQKRL